MFRSKNKVFIYFSAALLVCTTMFHNTAAHAAKNKCAAALSNAVEKANEIYKNENRDTFEDALERLKNTLSTDDARKEVGNYKFDNAVQSLFAPTFEKDDAKIEEITSAKMKIFEILVQHLPPHILSYNLPEGGNDSSDSLSPLETKREKILKEAGSVLGKAASKGDKSALNAITLYIANFSEGKTGVLTRSVLEGILNGIEDMEIDKVELIAHIFSSKYKGEKTGVFKGELSDLSDSYDIKSISFSTLIKELNNVAENISSQRGGYVIAKSSLDALLSDKIDSKDLDSFDSTLKRSIKLIKDPVLLSRVLEQFMEIRAHDFGFPVGGTVLNSLPEDIKYRLMESESIPFSAAMLSIEATHKSLPSNFLDKVQPMTSADVEVLERVSERLAKSKNNKVVKESLSAFLKAASKRGLISKDALARASESRSPLLKDILESPDSGDSPSGVPFRALAEAKVPVENSAEAPDALWMEPDKAKKAVEMNIRPIAEGTDINLEVHIIDGMIGKSGRSTDLGRTKLEKNTLKVFLVKKNGLVSASAVNHEINNAFFALLHPEAFDRIQRYGVETPSEIFSLKYVSDLKRKGDVEVLQAVLGLNELEMNSLYFDIKRIEKELSSEKDPRAKESLNTELKALKNEYSRRKAVAVEFLGRPPLAEVMTSHGAGMASLIASQIMADMVSAVVFGDNDMLSEYLKSLIEHPEAHLLGYAEFAASAEIAGKVYDAVLKRILSGLEGKLPEEILLSGREFSFANLIRSSNPIVRENIVLLAGLLIPRAAAQGGLYIEDIVDAASMSAAVGIVHGALKLMALARGASATVSVNPLAAVVRLAVVLAVNDALNRIVIPMYKNWEHGTILSDHKERLLEIHKEMIKAGTLDEGFYSTKGMGHEKSENYADKSRLGFVEGIKKLFFGSSTAEGKKVSMLYLDKLISAVNTQSQYGLFKRAEEFNSMEREILEDMNQKLCVIGWVIDRGGKWYSGCDIGLNMDLYNRLRTARERVKGAKEGAPLKGEIDAAAGVVSDAAKRMYSLYKSSWAEHAVGMRDIAVDVFGSREDFSGESGMDDIPDTIIGRLMWERSIVEGMTGDVSGGVREELEKWVDVIEKRIESAEELVSMWNQITDMPVTAGDIEKIFGVSGALKFHGAEFEMKKDELPDISSPVKTLREKDEEKTKALRGLSVVPAFQ